MTERIVFPISLLPYILLIIVAPLAQGIGQKICLMVVFAIYVLIILKNKNIYFDSTLVPFTFWSVWNLIIFVYFGTGFEQLIQALMIPCIINGASILDESSLKKLKVLLKSCAICYLVSWIIYIPLSNKILNYQAYFGNSNTFGMMAFSVMFIILISRFSSKREKFFWVMLSVLFIIFSGSRASIIAMIEFYFVYCMLNKSSNLEQRKFRKTALFVLNLVMIMLISLVYPLMYGTELGFKLNILSRKIFNKNLFSGRQQLWTILFNYIKKAPFCGYGLGTTPSRFMNTTRSSHNLYLQTAIQIGLVGLVILLFLLYKLCCSLNVDYQINIYICSFLMASMIHDTFEVSLTQNNWPQGFFLWLVLGMAFKSKTITRYNRTDRLRI